MSGLPVRSKHAQYLAAVAALVGVVGYAVFGWRFGDGSSASLPLAVAFVALAVASTLYRQLRG